MMQKALLTMLFYLVPYFVFGQSQLEQIVVTSEAILGDELQFAITFNTEEQVTCDFSKIVFNGESIPFKDSVGQSGFKSVVNGRVVQDSIVYQHKVLFSFRPSSIGAYQLPAMPFSVGGVEHFTKPMSFKVIDIPVDPNVFFNFQILDNKVDLFPSEEFTLRVIIAVKEYTDMVNEPLVISNFTFANSSLLEYIPEAEPSMMVYLNGSPFKVRLMAAANNGSFENYNKVYFFDMKYKVLNSGALTLDKSIFKGSFQTSETNIQRDIFGRRRAVPVVKTVFSKSNTVSINCLSLPTNNVPDSYNGAVGDFQFDVVCSSDTGVKVGDPVTLIVTIKGKGNWEKVQAPPLHKYNQINDYFRVSENQPPGLLNDAKTEKVFNIKLRVKSKLVTEIPSFEFSYFDVMKKEYKILKSKAIPIKVFENSKEVEIVDFATKENENNKILDDKIKVETVEPKAFDLKPVKIEIRDILVGDYRSNHAINAFVYYLSLIPFVLLLVMQLLKALGSREISEEQQIKYKEKNAYNIFKEKAKSISFDSSSNPYRELGVCFDEFFRNRFPGKFSIIEKQVFQKLEENKLISSSTQKILLEGFEKIEEQRYSNKKTSANDFEDLRNKIDSELKNV